jgi:hypothetical protein
MAPPSNSPPEPLSPSELDAVSALLPHLLSTGHVPTIGRLLSSALLLLGSLERLSLPSLAALPTHSPVVVCSTVAHRDARGDGASWHLDLLVLALMAYRGAHHRA